MYKIALVVVAYNRLDSVSRILDSLNRSDYGGKDVTLIISVDKSNTDVVEKYAKDYSWKYGQKIVSTHEKNMGLRNHMLSLGSWFKDFDTLVILEDDIVVSPNFFSYVEQTVEKYAIEDQIAGISLFNFGVNYQTKNLFEPLKSEYDVYFMNCAMSWGEVWMKKQWKDFYNWYEKHLDFPTVHSLPTTICSWSNKSWLKYHTRYCIENNKYFVYPYTSFTTNMGDEGVHHRKGSRFETILTQVPLQYGSIGQLRLPDFTESCICYDGFFENKALYTALNLKEEECCLDLNSSNTNPMHKRYWLSTRLLDYKIIKSYALLYRPIEINIINKTDGHNIFLYDTSVVEKNPYKEEKALLLYGHRVHDIFSFLLDYGFFRMLKTSFLYTLDILKKRIL